MYVIFFTTQGPEGSNRQSIFYRKIFVIAGPSGTERVTFDACEGSDENHYWDHHNGFNETHITGS